MATENTTTLVRTANVPEYKHGRYRYLLGFIPSALSFWAPKEAFELFMAEMKEFGLQLKNRLAERLEHASETEKKEEIEFNWGEATPASLVEDATGEIDGFLKELEGYRLAAIDNGPVMCAAAYEESLDTLYRLFREGYLSDAMAWCEHKSSEAWWRIFENDWRDWRRGAFGLPVTPDCARLQREHYR
jgi:hypothetical protein